MDESDLYPALAGFPPAVTDIANAPRDSTDLRLAAAARGWELLPEYPSLTRLWCFTISQPRLDAIARCRSLKRLYLDGIRVPLQDLARLTDLDVLSIESATRLPTLAEIPRLSDLRGLSVTNAPRVASLRPLSAGRGLRALNVSGGIWSRMTIDSLVPLERLEELRYLALANLKVRDWSLEPLGALVGLQKLTLANSYPMREFARLSARLKHTECQWFKPFVEFSAVPCPRCGTTSLVIPSGKGLRTMCRRCDEERIRRHEDAFRQAAV